jgi:predicted Zn-dependent peptidase
VFVSSFIRGIERIGGFGGKADILAECATFTGDPGCFRKGQAAIDSATPADLQAVGARWLTKGDYTLVVEPVAAGTAPPPMKDDSTANEPYATRDRPVPAIDPKFTTLHSDVDRSKGVPAVTSFPEVNFPTLQRATLSNGIKIVLAERHEIPVVQMSMVFKGGFAADTGGKLGTSSFTMGMLDEGAGKYDSLALGDREEILGAQISSGADLDGDTVYLSALKVNLDESLDLYSDVIRRPTFDPKEIDRVRKSWLAGIAQEKTQPIAIAFRLLPPLMYGAGHPYAIPLTGNGTEDSIQSLTREDLVGFAHRWLRPDSATLVVVGDTRLKELVPLLEKHFGDWKAPAEPLSEVKIASAALQPKPRVFLVDQPGAIQATIVAGQPVQSSMQPDFWNFTLANDVLGGQFSSRLNMNLREAKHWAYGAESSASFAVGQQPWMAFAQVQIDKAAESMTEMQREISEYVGKAPATAAELEKVKADNIRKMPGQYETGQAALGVIEGIVTYHRGDDYVQTKKARIEAISLDDVHAAAREIRPEALTWVVIGDLSKIEAPVRALNLGEVTVLDADGKPVAPKAAAKPAK